MTELPTIAKRFTDYYKLLNKEESVTVISAAELSESQKGKLADTLSSSNSGTKFTIKYQVGAAAN